MRLDVTVAFLTAMLAGYAALDLLPSTVLGRTIAFGVFLAALYPMDRLMSATKDRPAWQHWVGVALGVATAWILYTLNERYPVSDDVSLVLGVITGILVLAAFVYSFLVRGGLYR